MTSFSLDDDTSNGENGSRPLGAPLPDDAHACSVSLPTWASVVGYEEGDALISSLLKCGYPRFVYHPYVLELMQQCCQKYSSGGTEDCVVMPSRAAALRCQAFLRQALYQKVTNDVCDINDSTTLDKDTNTGSNNDIRVIDLETSTHIHAVMFPAQTLPAIEAKAYWQHTGEVVSSRRAEVCLQELDIPMDHLPVSTHCRYHAMYSSNADKNTMSSPHDLVKDRIATLANVPSDHVYLTTSGMASIYSALLSSRRACGTDKASVVFGFPYLDTLKLCSRTEFCKGGVEFFGHGHDRDLAALDEFLQRKKVSAVFTEIPSNPLLQCPNLEKLRQLTDQHGVCLVVDDTIGNFLNLDLVQTGLADVVCTSLTKLFSGRGDVMAGSLIANPNTRIGNFIQQDLSTQEEESSLFEADAWAIWRNSHSFAKRNERINRTASQLADYLMEHNDVDRIYYPKYTTHYTKYSNKFGGLFSILLDSHICQRSFFDALNVAKGPSLGTNFTLACPYTLLAHYHELDFAMSYNVQPNLLRISVGLEDFEELRGKFSTALAASRLHPKITSGSSAGGAVRPYSTTTRMTRFVAKQCSPSFFSGKQNRSSIRAALKILSRGRGLAL